MEENDGHGELQDFFDVTETYCFLCFMWFLVDSVMFYIHLKGSNLKVFTSFCFLGEYITQQRQLLHHIIKPIANLYHSSPKLITLSFSFLVKK